MMESLHELQKCRHRNHSKPSSSENSMEVETVLLFFWVLSSSIIFKTLEQVRTSQPKQFTACIVFRRHCTGKCRGFCGLWLPPIRFPSLQIEKLIRDGISAHQFGSPFPQSTTSMASANLTTLKRDVRYDAWFAAMPFHFSASVGKRMNASRCSSSQSFFHMFLLFWADGCCFFRSRMKDGWEILGDHPTALKVKARWSAMAPRHCPCQLWTKWQLWEHWQSRPLWVRHSKMHMHHFTVFLVLQLSLCFFCSFPIRCSWILIVASRGTAWECDPGRVVVLPILKIFENGEIRQRFCCGLQMLLTVFLFGCFLPALVRAWDWGPKDAKHFMFKGHHQGCVCYYVCRGDRPRNH